MERKRCKGISPSHRTHLNQAPADPKWGRAPIREPEDPKCGVALGHPVCLACQHRTSTPPPPTSANSAGQGGLIWWSDVGTLSLSALTHNKQLCTVAVLWAPIPAQGPW